MKHFINLKDIPAKDLRKIITDAKKRKNLRKKLSTLEVDKGAPLSISRVLSFFLKLFLFLASAIIFLRSFAGISFKLMKCFILFYLRTNLFNNFYC